MQTGNRILQTENTSPTLSMRWPERRAVVLLAISDISMPVSDSDNSHYEKLDGIERCIDDEIPFEIPDSWE